jgi:hypothetical protein
MNLKSTFIVGLILALLCSPAEAAGEESVVTVTVDRPQMAGIAGFRGLWDTPIRLDEGGATEIKDKQVKGQGATAVWSPEKRRGGQAGVLAFDALQRSALIRFPDAAEKIAAQVRKGYEIKKVELILPYKDTELWPVGDTNFPPPDGYLYRENFGVAEFWRHTPPRWHAVAWALRKPWTANEKLGPTFNAYINGAGYWAKYGAQDEKADRFPSRFGPVEVSHQKTVARMDVTAMLTSREFGATLGERLRSLADCGFLLKKWEIYDHRYYHQVYEWATATGGRAILIRAPKLEVSLAATMRPESIDKLPPPADVEGVARRLQQSKSGGLATAALPTKAELEKWDAQARERPSWMPEWQWRHVQELANLTSIEKKTKPFWYQFVDEGMLKFRIGQRVQDKKTKQWVRSYTPEDVYAAWIDSLIARQPRGWYGFEAAKEMTQWYLYSHAMAGPARDNVRLLWTAWLMPDRSAKELEHPMVDQLAKKPVTDKDFVDSYYAKTGDWRGDKSFYRDGFCYAVSTQNFNTTASTGALLGGALIGSKNAMEDGRHGVENLMLRAWCWGQGASQENIDHYYFPITVTGQKAIADFGQTLMDRLVGQSMLTKSMDEVIAAYHPNLKRFIAGSSRTSLEYLLVTQDGLQYIMHTLLPAGALHDLTNARIPGKLPALGHEVLPERIAQQTSISPWAPDWAANKSLPFEETSFREGAWLRGYQGENYGLASVSRHWPRSQIMGQWRRSDRPVENVNDLVTMTIRYGMNNTRFVNDEPGFSYAMGQQAVLQHKNKMIVVSNFSPTDWLKKTVSKDGLQSLQSSLALFNYESSPSWEIYVDDTRVSRLPFKAKQSQRITINDGITYLGVMALPATDLGRTDEVVLRSGEDQTYQNMTYRAALVIDSFNLQRSSPDRMLSADDVQRFQKSFAGFAVELGDIKEYGSFNAFQKHFRGAKLQATWDPKKEHLKVSYVSGDDRMEGTFLAQAKVRELVDCKVSGKGAYLPKGILRDTSFSQQGNTGELKKDGAVLKTDPGAMAYLRSDPTTQTFLALKPLPGPASFSLALPKGIRIWSDGRIALARVIVRTKSNEMWIDCARREDQGTLCKSLLVSGMSVPPKVVLNGQAMREQPTTKSVDGRSAYVIPLP